MGEDGEAYLEREIKRRGRQLADAAMRELDVTAARAALGPDLELRVTANGLHWQVRRKAAKSSDRVIVAQWWPTSGRFVYGEDFRHAQRALDIDRFVQRVRARHLGLTDVTRRTIAVPTTEIVYDERTGREVSRSSHTGAADVTELREPETWHGRLAERCADLLRELGAMVEAVHRPGDSKLRIIPDRSVLTAPSHAVAVLTISRRKRVAWDGHPDVIAWAREPLEAHGEALASAAGAGDV